jgi:hypothetical protein
MHSLESPKVSEQRETRFGGPATFGLVQLLSARVGVHRAAAWTEIEACLVRGMKRREVWEAAKLDGLEIPYRQFRVYVSRLRRRRQRLPISTSTHSPVVTNGAAELLAPVPPDPRKSMAATINVPHPPPSSTNSPSADVKPPSSLALARKRCIFRAERKQIPHLRVMARNIRFLKSELEPAARSSKGGGELPVKHDGRVFETSRKQHLVDRVSQPESPAPSRIDPNRKL